MRFLLLLLATFVLAASAAEPTPPAPPVERPAAEVPIRVAVTQAQVAELRLTVPERKPAAPQRWLLLLAGLALAGWIAHRRLSYL